MAPPQLLPSQNKVAIPRLKNQAEPAPLPAENKSRVTHACEACRQRKVKCTGERPICKHCSDFDLQCLYSDGKRDRFKRDYARVKVRNTEIVNFLRQLSTRVSAADQEQIRRLLHRSGEEQSIASSPVATPSRERSRSGSTHGESDVGAEVGSNDSLDVVEEDLDKDSTTRAIGYVGAQAEVRWLRRAKQQTDQGGGHEEDARVQAPYGPPGRSDQANAQRIHAGRERRGSHPAGDMGEFSGSGYRMDDNSIFLHDQVDPWELPLPDTGEILVKYFVDFVLSDFPILSRTEFTQTADKIHQQLRSNPIQVRIEHKMRAILNLAYAIGAKFAHLIEKPQGNASDHLIFHTRARMLGMNGDSFFSHPDYQQIQISALMGFYYMCTSQISRAWLMSGWAIRYSFALGLHVRNEDPNMKGGLRELRVRAWYAVWMLERLLGVISGRPSSIVDDRCSTPFPIPMDEDKMLSEDGEALISQWNLAKSPSQTASPQSNDSGQLSTQPSYEPQPGPNQGRYLRYLMFLFKLIDDAVNKLYVAGTVTKSWTQIQGDITGLLDAAERWLQDLPPEFDFTDPRAKSDKRRARETAILGFFYYSCRIIITRPCLCRVDSRIAHQTEKSKQFNKDTARKCVHAALNIISLLPAGEPDPVRLWKLGPWWCMLHLLMQASSVIILECSYWALHMPEEAKEIFDKLKILVGWLYEMGKDDEAAKRAWRTSKDLLLKVAPRIDGNVSDVRTASPTRYWTDAGVPDSLSPSSDRHTFASQAQGAHPSAFASLPERPHSSPSAPPQSMSSQYVAHSQQSPTHQTQSGTRGYDRFAIEDYSMNRADGQPPQAYAAQQIPHSQMGSQQPMAQQRPPSQNQQLQYHQHHHYYTQQQQQQHPQTTQQPMQQFPAQQSQSQQQQILNNQYLPMSMSMSMSAEFGPSLTSFYGFAQGNNLFGMPMLTMYDNEPPPGTEEQDHVLWDAYMRPEME